MNYRESKSSRHGDEVPQSPADEGPRREPLPMSEVPVYSAVVYVRRSEAGGVHARVANLSGLEFQARDERSVLAQVVAGFKQRIRECLERSEPIPWTEPPLEPLPGEQKRLVPVHL